MTQQRKSRLSDVESPQNSLYNYDLAAGGK